MIIDDKYNQIIIIYFLFEDIIARPGENIGIVGGSGSGKSTISSLLGGFYRVNEGEVLLDGVNINNLSGEYIRRLVSIVCYYHSSLTIIAIHHS